MGGAPGVHGGQKGAKPELENSFVRWWRASEVLKQQQNSCKARLTGKQLDQDHAEGEDV
jgi:hypothetical protein